jgi:hypothetical protein
MPRKFRKSFWGHPSANLFLTISLAGGFQQPRLISSIASGRSSRTRTSSRRIGAAEGGYGVDKRLRRTIQTVFD